MEGWSQHGYEVQKQAEIERALQAQQREQEELRRKIELIREKALFAPVGENVPPAAAGGVPRRQRPTTQPLQNLDDNMLNASVQQPAPKKVKEASSKPMVDVTTTNPQNQPNNNARSPTPTSTLHSISPSPTSCVSGLSVATPPAVAPSPTAGILGGGMGMFGAQQQASLWAGGTTMLLSHLATHHHEEHTTHLSSTPLPPSSTPMLDVNVTAPVPVPRTSPVSPSPSSPDKALISMQEELQQELAVIRQERQKLLAAVSQRRGEKASGAEGQLNFEKAQILDEVQSRMRSGLEMKEQKERLSWEGVMMNALRELRELQEFQMNLSPSHSLQTGSCGSSYHSSQISPTTQLGSPASLGCPTTTTTATGCTSPTRSSCTPTPMSSSWQGSPSYDSTADIPQPSPTTSPSAASNDNASPQSTTIKTVTKIDFRDFVSLADTQVQQTTAGGVPRRRRSSHHSESEQHTTFTSNSLGIGPNQTMQTMSTIHSTTASPPPTTNQTIQNTMSSPSGMTSGLSDMLGHDTENEDAAFNTQQEGEEEEEQGESGNDDVHQIGHQGSSEQEVEQHLGATPPPDNILDEHPLLATGDTVYSNVDNVANAMRRISPISVAPFPLPVPQQLPVLPSFTSVPLSNHITAENQMDQEIEPETYRARSSQSEPHSVTSAGAPPPSSHLFGLHNGDDGMANAIAAAAMVAEIERANTPSNTSPTYLPPPYQPAVDNVNNNSGKVPRSNGERVSPTAVEQVTDPIALPAQQQQLLNDNQLIEMMLHEQQQFQLRMLQELNAATSQPQQQPQPTSGTTTSPQTVVPPSIGGLHLGHSPSFQQIAACQVTSGSPSPVSNLSRSHSNTSCCTAIQIGPNSNSQGPRISPEVCTESSGRESVSIALTTPSQHGGASPSPLPLLASASHTPTSSQAQDQPDDNKFRAQLEYYRQRLEQQHRAWKTQKEHITPLAHQQYSPTASTSSATTPHLLLQHDEQVEQIQEQLQYYAYQQQAVQTAHAKAMGNSSTPSPPVLATPQPLTGKSSDSPDTQLWVQDSTPKDRRGQAQRELDTLEAELLTSIPLQQQPAPSPSPTTTKDRGISPPLNNHTITLTQTTDGNMSPTFSNYSSVAMSVHTMDSLWQDAIKHQQPTGGLIEMGDATQQEEEDEMLNDDTVIQQPQPTHTQPMGEGYPTSGPQQYDNGSVGKVLSPPRSSAAAQHLPSAFSPQRGHIVAHTVNTMNRNVQQSHVIHTHTQQQQFTSVGMTSAFDRQQPLSMSIHTSAVPQVELYNGEDQDQQPIVSHSSHAHPHFHGHIESPSNTSPPSLGAIPRGVTSTPPASSTSLTPQSHEFLGGLFMSLCQPQHNLTLSGLQKIHQPKTPPVCSLTTFLRLVRHSQLLRHSIGLDNVIDIIRAVQVNMNISADYPKKGKSKRNSSNGVGVVSFVTLEMFTIVIVELIQKLYQAENNIQTSNYTSIPINYEYINTFIAEVLKPTYTSPCNTSSTSGKSRTKSKVNVSIILSSDNTLTAILHPVVIETLSRNKHALLEIFTAFATCDNNTTERTINNIYMTLKEYTQFAFQFDIVPSFVQKSTIVHKIFPASCFNSCEDDILELITQNNMNNSNILSGNLGNVKMHFPEWTESLVRLAIENSSSSKATPTSTADCTAEFTNKLIQRAQYTKKLAQPKSPQNNSRRSRSRSKTPPTPKSNTNAQGLLNKPQQAPHSPPASTHSNRSPTSTWSNTSPPPPTNTAGIPSAPTSSISGGGSRASTSGSPCSTANIKPHQPQQLPPQALCPEYSELIHNQHKLRDELQRIFIQHCLIGCKDATSSTAHSVDLLTLPRFQKFLTEIKVLSTARTYANSTPNHTSNTILAGHQLSNSEAEKIFMEVAQDSPFRTRDGQQVFLGFQSFMNSLTLAASQFFVNVLPPSQALLKLLLEYVLPNASRLSGKYTEVNVDDPTVVALCQTHKKTLTVLFTVYSTQITRGKPDMSVMGISSFLKFCQDFEILPNLLSRQDMLKVYVISTVVDRNTTNNGELLPTTELSCPAFVNSLIRIAYVCYGKHPYMTRYLTLHSKVSALLDHIGVCEYVQLKTKLERLGHSIPAYIPSLARSHSNSNQRTRTSGGNTPTGKQHVGGSRSNSRSRARGNSNLSATNSSRNNSGSPPSGRATGHKGAPTTPAHHERNQTSDVDPQLMQYSRDVYTTVQDTKIERSPIKGNNGYQVHIRQTTTRTQQHHQRQQQQQQQQLLLASQEVDRQQLPGVGDFKHSAAYQQQMNLMGLGLMDGNGTMQQTSNLMKANKAFQSQQLYLQQQQQQQGGAVVALQANETTSPSPTTTMRTGSPYPIDNLTEEELDVALYETFMYYATYATGSHNNNKEKITGSNYAKLCRDARIISHNFPVGRVDLVYSEAVQGKHSAMTFGVFCDSLLVLAQKKFKNMPQSEALRRLLLDYILPFASRSSSYTNTLPNDDDLLEAYNDVQLYDGVLIMVFDSFKMYHGNQSPESGQTLSGIGYLDSTAFFRMMAAFDVYPDLLTDGEVHECFQVALGESSTPRPNSNGMLEYEQFLIAIACCCLRAFAHNTNFSTVLEKVDGLLLGRMDLRNTKKLQKRLQSAAFGSVSPLAGPDNNVNDIVDASLETTSPTNHQQH